MSRKSRAHLNSVEVHLDKIFPRPVTDMQAILDTHILQMTKRGDSEALTTLVALEAYGGECPECGKLWKKIEVKNHYADFYYFDPTCKCFPRCGRCGTSLHREWVTQDKMPCTCQKTPGAQ